MSAAEEAEKLTVAKERQSYAKRDALIKIEREIEQIWEDEKTFETDAPPAGSWTPEEKNKYLITFPYPYMNGRLHLGHAFSLTKAEFASGYKRLKGVHTIWPFGFHCTGMPIQASADRLKREIEQYGAPPQGVPERVRVEPPAKKAVEKAKGAPKDIKATKGKLAGKSGDSAAWSRPLLQWEIMLSLGVEEADIPKFADPYHWLAYFPPLGMSDMKRFGATVDWRRSFITTDRNPFYDSFVRWQYNKLKALGKIAYGKRPCVYSVRDNGPCADHDRQTGEGVGVQDFTLIKMHCVEVPAALASAVPEGAKVYFVCGTLRPETMYGQTNCWVGPEEAYGLYASAKEGEYLVCGEWSALNMAYQQILATEDATPAPLATCKGTDLIGTPLAAPLAAHERIYALPFMGIKAGRATGIVTSVPSDAPDDYAGLMDLKNKAPLREKFGVKDEWVLPFDPVPIIDTPGFGNLAAVEACKQFKIASQNDRDGLDKAKKEVYLRGFYEGVMLVGDHKGKTVQDAKPLIKAGLIAAGQAIAYGEPEKPVISRSGDKCIVANADQWYLTYGEDQWRTVTEGALEGVETFAEETRNAFKRTLEWLNKWACSRSYGLGTRLPFDEKWLVESLSDSTIYMAYYTVAHLLQGAQGGLDGTKTGPLGIAPEDVNDAVWDHLLLGTPAPSDCAIAPEHLATMRNEFEYWYGVDLRVSGKDLVPNHLTFFLYAHTAIWADQPDKWPKGIRANGHVLLNKEKMSKSTGNFMTLYDACETYSADAMRISLANAGDTLDDANFEDEVANAAILKLTTMIEFAEELFGAESALAKEGRTGPATTYADRLFENNMNKSVVDADVAYEKALYRDALTKGVFTFINARDQYRTLSEGNPEGPNVDLLRRWLKDQVVMIAPLAPHVAEHLWRNVLGNKGTVFGASFPQPSAPVDPALDRAGEYIERTARSFRLRKLALLDPKKKGKAKKGAAVPELTAPPTKMIIVIGHEYPEWQRKVLGHLDANWNDETNTVGDGFMKDIKADPSFAGKEFKNAMQFAAYVREDASVRGRNALELTSPFDEASALEAVLGYLCTSLQMEEITIRTAAEALADDMGGMLKTAADQATPGNPTCLFLSA